MFRFFKRKPAPPPLTPEENRKSFNDLKKILRHTRPLNLPDPKPLGWRERRRHRKIAKAHNESLHLWWFLAQRSIDLLPVAERDLER